jgi:hypothetical protein
MLMKRWDETWHRLREWTNGQAPAERLAAQILLAEGFSGIDPSHPLGGPDGGKDAIVAHNGERWVMAAYFPRGQVSFREIKAKFLADHAGALANDASGIAFVTNQELRLNERQQLEEAADTQVELFHLERITAILDQPRLHGVRDQFLLIPAEGSTDLGDLPTAAAILDSGAGPSGAPEHRDIYDGMLLLKIAAIPVPAGLRHPGASDPKSALCAASERAQELGCAVAGAQSSGAAPRRGLAVKRAAPLARWADVRRSGPTIALSLRSRQLRHEGLGAVRGTNVADTDL